LYFSRRRVSDVQERMAESSERAESDAVEELSKGDKEEADDSPARRIPSRIGPAEAEGAKALRQNRRMKQIDRIWRERLIDMGEDGLLSGKNILKIDRANIPALIIVHFNGDQESVIRIEGAEGRESVCHVVRKLLPMGQICFQMIAAVKGVAGDEEFTGGGKGRNFQIIEHIRRGGRR
jgi:hypothetical protein